MFWASNISMFALLPLAYFYHEAAGFGSKFNSTWWRMFEAALLWVLFSAILGGFVYLARSLYTTTHSSPDYSPFAYSLMSLLGSLFILWYTPGGVVVLGRASYNLFRTYKVLVPANRQELIFEKDSLKFKLFKLETQQLLGEEASQARFSSTTSSSFNPYTIAHSGMVPGVSAPNTSPILPPNPTDTIWTKFSLLPTHKRGHLSSGPNSPFSSRSSDSIQLYRYSPASRLSRDTSAPGDWLNVGGSLPTPARSLQRASVLQQQLIRRSASKARRKSNLGWDDDDDWEADPPSPGDFLSPSSRNRSTENGNGDSKVGGDMNSSVARGEKSNGATTASRGTKGSGSNSDNSSNSSDDETLTFRHETITPELLDDEDYTHRSRAESQQNVETLRWILQHSTSIAKSASAANKSRRAQKQAQIAEVETSGSVVRSFGSHQDEKLGSRIDYHNQDAVTQEVDWLEAQKEYADVSRRLKQVQRELAAYEQEPEKVTILSSFRWMLRNLLAIILTAVNLALPLLLFIRAADARLRPYIATEGAVYYYSFLYPDERSSTIWFTSEIALIIYLTAAAFSGLFTSSLMSRFQPQRHATGMHKVIVCIFFSLVLASAIPVAGRLLGLISFDLMGTYDNLEYLQNQYLAAGMQSMFALLLLIRYLEFFPWTNYVLQTIGRAFDWANSPFALS